MYNALLYTTKHRGWVQWIWEKHEGATPGQIRDWLAQSPWGRCVYRCDNTAVDHQVSAMTFGSGATATLTMTAFDEGRSIEIRGTRARLHGGEPVKRATGHDIMVTDHAAGDTTTFDVNPATGGYDGHWGGDAGLMMALYDEMTKENAGHMQTSLAKSVESHVMAFAAEQSRVSGQTVSLDTYRRQHASAAQALSNCTIAACVN